MGKKGRHNVVLTSPFLRSSNLFLLVLAHLDLDGDAGVVAERLLASDVQPDAGVVLERVPACGERTRRTRRLVGPEIGRHEQITT